MTRSAVSMIAAVALAAAYATVAGAQIRQAGSRHGHGVGTSVAAALSPVGGVEGWGRIAVHDLTEGDLVERTVNVELHGLEPAAEYTVVADGVVVGVATTDADGEAWLALRTDHHLMPPVPADLPPAGDLVSATVLDASAALMLEGSFVTIAHGEPGMGPQVYQERIRLEPIHDIWQRGVARVARDVDDEQFFDTRAHGLTEGTPYRIVVDGVDAGIATADAVGQAVLALSTEEGSLPVSLQPVEDLRLVEWLADGVAVLSGSFTGEGTNGGPRHDDPHGTGDGDCDGDCDGDGPHGPGGGGDDGDGDGPHGPGDGDGDCDGPHGGGRP